MSIFKNKLFKIFGIIFVILIFVWVWVFVEEQQKFLEIDFFDVGQGDAIFIETPNKKQVLIDGGPGLTILDKLGKEMPFWDRYIDLVVLTHPEYDHLGGLIEVAKRYKIGGIVTVGVVRDTDDYQEWQKIIEQERIPILIAQAGGIINLDNNIKFIILYPFENLSGVESKDSNNTSIVGQLVYKDFELLLTGDIEKKTEKELIKSGTNLASDILKVAHHGSKTSTTEEFLKAVNPIVSVIQFGKDNSYGHPHQEVLDRLKQFGQIFGTGKDGDVEILSDGIKFQIK